MARPKGSLNKAASNAKDAIQECFNMMGGVDSLHAWAANNASDFYTKIWPKILPLKLTNDKDDPLYIVTRIERHIVDKNDSLKD